MQKITGISRQPGTRHRITIRHIVAASALLAVAASLSACATSGVVSETGSDAAWEGAKPKPMTMSSSSSYAPTPRIGSQPLLPPVPEETNGLAPIKMSALAE